MTLIPRIWSLSFSSVPPVSHIHVVSDERVVKIHRLQSNRAELQVTAFLCGPLRYMRPTSEPTCLSRACRGAYLCVKALVVCKCWIPGPRFTRPGMTEANGCVSPFSHAVLPHTPIPSSPFPACPEPVEGCPRFSVFLSAEQVFSFWLLASGF